MKQQRDRLPSLGAEVCEVNYEDLTQNTAAVMQKVCAFLRIPFDDELANLRGADRSTVYAGEQHALLRGDKIVAGPRPDVLDPGFRSKVAQYVNWWRCKYEGAWPEFPRAGVGNQPLPNCFQRVWDRLRYLVLQAVDRLRVLAFCFSPTSLVLKHRRQKYGAEPSRIHGGQSVKAATQSLGVSD